MIVFPGIHLRQGKLAPSAGCEATTERDPVLQAMLFAQAGAEHLHVVDLDGESGSANRETVERIVEDFPGYVQLASDVSTPSDVEGWFNRGVARLVIDSAALDGSEFVKDMARAWEGGILVAARMRDGLVSGSAAEAQGRPVHELARCCEDMGVASLLVTDLDRAGRLMGCDIDAMLDLARRTRLPLIVRGGIRGIDDIHVLALHAREGIEGVISHRALAEGRLDLGAALAIAARA